MGFLSDLFKKGEEPLLTFTDSKLGLMKWSEEDESWIGECNGIKFSLAYERKSSVPVKELVVYATEFLGDQKSVNASLEQAKREAQNEYSKSYKGEIESLRIGVVHFYRHKDKRRIIADLMGGENFRSWRIEYNDKNCEGIGFDS